MTTYSSASCGDERLQRILAPCFRAPLFVIIHYCLLCTRSFSSTNRNSACGSTNRLISQGHATRSTLMSFRVIHFMFTSRSPGICEFNGEAIFIELWWVCRNQAREALPGSIDHIQVAVRTIIPSQANVCGCRLSVGRVHLEQRREREKTGKRVIGLKAAEHHREAPQCRRQYIARGVGHDAQPETVPLLSEVECETFIG